MVIPCSPRRRSWGMAAWFGMLLAALSTPDFGLHRLQAVAAVQAGANHWAYQPMHRPAIPRVDCGSTMANPIDAFIRNRLLAANLKPAAAAPGEVWLRRVTYDLTGLAPTSAERIAFLSDSRADARARVIDRLLASPRHGERWARHWMDAVHFAESHGHDQDRIRTNAWPYRDYLVHAFNADHPYARFVQEQLAADVLFPGNPELVPALGLAAAGPWDESSLRCIREDASDRQAARYIDRDDMVTTVMQTFTSTTVQCARCHDHKFDPVSQRDYYALQAVFAGVERANRIYDQDPDRNTLRQRLRSALRQVKTDSGTDTKAPVWWTTAIQTELAAWEADRSRKLSQWQVTIPDRLNTTAGSRLRAQADGVVIAEGSRPAMEDYEISLPTSSHEVRAVRLEALADASLPRGGPGRQDNGNFHLSEFELWNGTERVALERATADFNQEGWTIAAAIDGSDKTAWGIHPEEGTSHVAVFLPKAPVKPNAAARLKIVLKQRHGGGHLLGRFRISVSSDAAAGFTPLLPPALEKAFATPRGSRTLRERVGLARWVVTRRLESELAALPPPDLVFAPAADFDPDGGLKPVTEPRRVSVLRRGEFTRPMEDASPGSLSCVTSLPARFALPDDAPESARRAALAAWIVDPSNPLTWRSIVNRVWHLHFGRGLVATPNDFGRMGAAPSHPELLDWLAVWFRDEAHGSLKALHRLIVTSDTFAQSSRPDDADPQGPATDADNALLWRMNRSRLDAEAVRDTLLEASGTLDLRMGGPGDRQFDLQPGIHVTPKVDYARFDRDSEAGSRRSLYRFLFRTLPDPFMDALDCPAGDQLTPVRTSGITVQQALALWNDELVLRQAARLAASLQRELPDRGMEQHLAVAVERLYARPARPSDLAELLPYARRHGLAATCRLLFNSNEFIFVD